MPFIYKEAINFQDFNYFGKHKSGRLGHLRRWAGSSAVERPPCTRERAQRSPRSRVQVPPGPSILLCLLAAALGRIGDGGR